MSINAKQRKFIDAYLISMNATKAAENAGYSKKTAYSIGQRLLQSEEIKTEIDHHLDLLHEQQKRTFIALSDSAIMALNDVVTNGRGLAKVNAANSILDRAGHKPVDRLQSDVNAKIDADVNVDDARQELIDKFNRRYPLGAGEECAVDVVEPKNSEIITD